MGQNQTKASKLASKQGTACAGTKLNRHLLTNGGTEQTKTDKTSQLQMILQKCKEHPSSGVIIGSSDACQSQQGKRSKPAPPARPSNGYTSNESVLSHGSKLKSEAKTSRPSSACSRPSISSPAISRTAAETSRHSSPRTYGDAQRFDTSTVQGSHDSVPPPAPPAEGALTAKASSQQSKRKRKQRKTLKSLKLRRGSNSSLVSRRRSSRKKREMSQLNKSWLAVSGDLDGLGMDMFRRVADLCPEITRTISGLPEGTPISTHLLLSHPKARQHARRVMETVGMVVDSYSEFDRVRPLLVMLGRHHAKYGVEERQLMVIGEALIFTLQDHLGDEWTATLADTWASLYAMIYGALLEGIKQRQAPASGLERGHHLRASFKQAQANGLTSPATSSRSSPTGIPRKPGLSRKLSRRSTGAGHKSMIVSGERKISA